MTRIRSEARSATSTRSRASAGTCHCAAQQRLPEPPAAGRCRCRPDRSPKLQTVPPARLLPAPAMAHLFFAASIQRHIDTPERDIDARTLGEALETVFGEQPRLRGYIVDDQGALRKHLSVFIDGQPVRDRQHLSDALGDASRVYVVQALSGG